MSVFTNKGMLKFPNRKDANPTHDTSHPYIIKECYCPNGHSLINEDIMFNNSKGIMVEVSRFNENGKLALSPVYGCKNKITLDISLKMDELYDIKCPTCHVLLPAFNDCHCGGKIVSLFMDKKAEFNNFVGVCNRIGCKEAKIRLDEELIQEVMGTAL